jgi:uncharacterized protein (TIGR03067 family)
MRTLAILLLCSAAISARQDKQDENGQKELKKLVGTWTLAAGQVDGKAIPDEQVKANGITWDGNKVTLTSPHQSDDPIVARITRIDPTKKPAEMDWTRDAGPNKDKPMMAIYEWVDDDTYRICFDPACKERPKDFKAAAGTGYIVHTWKRVK